MSGRSADIYILDELVVRGSEDLSKDDDGYEYMWVFIENKKPAKRRFEIMYKKHEDTSISLEQCAMLSGLTNRVIRNYDVVHQIAAKPDLYSDEMRASAGEALTQSVMDLYIIKTDIAKDIGVHKVPVSPLDIDKKTVEELREHIISLKVAMASVIDAITEGFTGNNYPVSHFVTLVEIWLRAISDLQKDYPRGTSPWTFTWTVSKGRNHTHQFFGAVSSFFKSE